MRRREIDRAWLVDGFFGYGCLNAKLWLLGMEEYCASDADAERRLPFLASFPETVGLKEAHNAYGFNELPRDVPVWDVARELAWATGLRAAEVGEPKGDVLLAEILPLPRPSNDESQWPPAYRVLFDDYGAYERELVRARAERVATQILAHSPRVVVVHGRKYHQQVEGALRGRGATPVGRLLSLGAKSARLLALNETWIIMVHNFGGSAGWSFDARARLADAVAGIFRGEAVDDLRMASLSIHWLLVGMFSDRGVRTIPRAVVATMPGMEVCARRASILNLVQEPAFRAWATRDQARLEWQSPMRACMERDLEDLSDARRRERLKRRYGACDDRSVRAAHARVAEWASRRTAS